MVKPPLEYAQIKQPYTLEMYVDKLRLMEDRTVIKYDGRWNALLNRQKEEFLADKLKALVARVINDANSFKIKPSTYRVYKAAICYGLASIYLKIENELIDENELDNGLNGQLLSSIYKEITTEKVIYTERENYKVRTSAMKKKSFPEGFYMFLKSSHETEEKLNPRFSLMFDFVEANLVVGLRPIEWLNVRITSDIASKTMVLFVQNAKNSNGRANGDYRELHLLSASKDQQKNILKFYINLQNKLKTSVDAFLDLQDNYERQTDFLTKKNSHIFNFIFENYTPTVIGNLPKSDICDDSQVPQHGIAELVLESLQNEMYIQYNRFLDGSEDVEQKRVSLYSTRHQCIANAKASKVNPFEIAGFFGHSSKETSSRHYGKAWSGWSNFTFRPSIESIRCVNGSEIYLSNIQAQETSNTVGNEVDISDFGFRF